MVTNAQVVAAANGLVSEHGENPEYDRALVELTCDLIGVSIDDRNLIATIIGVVSPKGPVF